MTIPDLLRSRAVWTALGPLVVAICSLAGVSDETTTAVLTLVTALAGFAGVSLARKVAGHPSSRAGVMAVLDKQQKEIALIRRAEKNSMGWTASYTTGGKPQRTKY